MPDGMPPARGHARRDWNKISCRWAFNQLYEVTWCMLCPTGRMNVALRCTFDMKYSFWTVSCAFMPCGMPVAGDDVEQPRQRLEPYFLNKCGGGGGGRIYATKG